MGAGHAPHHVTPEWSDAYAGRVRRRLGRVAPRDPGTPDRARHRRTGGTELPTPSEHVPDWDDMDPDQRRVAARMMEVYAGFLTHAGRAARPDPGRLDELGERDNTVVIVVSDNGASG